MQWTERIGRRIKLRDLHVLHTVVQAGSMTKAAHDMAISVPVVSKAIADLEHAVGVRLLERNPQGVEPTAYGRVLSAAAWWRSTNCGKASRTSSSSAIPRPGT